MGGQFLTKEMDKMGHVGPSGFGGVPMWPRRVYTRKKRDGERLNLTPKPDLAVPGKTEAPPGRCSAGLGGGWALAGVEWGHEQVP